MEGSVIVQTPAYSRFEEFAEKLKLCVHTVLAESEQDRFGVVQRVGLRYVDIVRARSGKGYRFYLRPGLHGLPDEVDRGVKMTKGLASSDGTQSHRSTRRPRARDKMPSEVTCSGA